MISEYFLRNVDDLSLMQEVINILRNTRKVGTLIQGTMYDDSNILINYEETLVFDQLMQP